ncbi:MAG: hypothetical protein ABI658_23610 [Acidimicrobiales bacterium]
MTLELQTNGATAVVAEFFADPSSSEIRWSSFGYASPPIRGVANSRTVELDVSNVAPRRGSTVGPNPVELAVVGTEATAKADLVSILPGTLIEANDIGLQAIRFELKSKQPTFEVGKTTRLSLEVSPIAPYQPTNVKLEVDKSDSLEAALSIEELADISTPRLVTLSITPRASGKFVLGVRADGSARNQRASFVLEGTAAERPGSDQTSAIVRVVGVGIAGVGLLLLVPRSRRRAKAA